MVALLLLRRSALAVLLRNNFYEIPAAPDLEQGW